MFELLRKSKIFSVLINVGFDIMWKGFWELNDAVLWRVRAGHEVKIWARLIGLMLHSGQIEERFLSV